MNPSRYWLDREIRTFAEGLPENSLVLDAGAGDQRYKPMFAAHRYESADFEMVDKKYASSTYVCDLASIPAEADRYDAILFSQVMEHLPEPAAVLKELHRVLKPGGRIFCSAPFFYKEHEKPYDFYRYTQFGFRHLFESAGFETPNVRWLEGFAGTIYFQIRWLAKTVPLWPFSGGGLYAWLLGALLLLMYPFLHLAGFLAKMSDRARRYTDQGYPSNYFVIAIKEKPDER